MLYHIFDGPTLRHLKMRISYVLLCKCLFKPFKSPFPCPSGHSNFQIFFDSNQHRGTHQDDRLRSCWREREREGPPEPAHPGVAAAAGGKQVPYLPGAPRKQLTPAHQLVAGASGSEEEQREVIRVYMCAL